MSSLSSSSASSSDLSRSNSVNNSMVSMNTEDHAGLYYHRQHPDPVPVHQETSVFPEEKTAKDLKCLVSRKQKKATRCSKRVKVENVPTRKRMDFEDADETFRHHQLGVSAILTSNARPSRLAHSMPHQRQLYVENNTSSKDVEPERDHNILPSTICSSTKHKLSVSSSVSPATKVRRPSQVNAILEMPRNSDIITPSKQTGPRRLTCSTTSTHSSINPAALLTQSVSRKSDAEDDAQQLNAVRMNTRTSLDSDVSQGSRDSQETEEDVCFPMAPPLHTRVNGIDFDELEEYAQFANAEKSQFLANVQGPSEQKYSNVPQDIGFTSSTSTSSSSAALKYTPRISQNPEKSDGTNETDIIEEEEEEEGHDDVRHGLCPGVSFGTNKIEGGDDGNIPNCDPSCSSYQNTDFQIPNRFSFFRSESDETVHASDIPSLVSEGQTFYELFMEGEPTWWLDCTCPTDDEMRCIAKAFGIHPLTAEDIRMQETREKVELFESYYFVCFHTFENDKESEDFLEPINVYIVVCRSGVLTFHFGPISHCANVRRRVRQLRDYVNVNSDWLCYALIDDITDSFAPVIQSIEYEADSIEDCVFMARDMDFAAMLQRIGESRRKTMTLMRLLSGKADVIKMFAKRCQDETHGIGPALTSQINIANLQSRQDCVNRTGNYGHETLLNHSAPATSQPRGGIALYLGDIQDHLLTMCQNLLAYERIFSRSYTNYLAQLQVESFNSNNKVTEMLGKVTMIGTMLVPLNVITGLFGMNVTVPGKNASIAWWFGILGVLIFLAILSWFLASYWIKNIDAPTTLNEAAESGAKSFISSFLPKRNRRFNDRSKSENIRVGPSNRSVASLPSRYSRYK